MMTSSHLALLILVSYAHHCVTDSTACNSHTCHHRGSCFLNNLRKPYCHCEKDYFGINCEYDASSVQCVKIPCKNGGRCGQKLNDTVTSCFCIPGYVGNECEVEYNECLPEPCINGDCIDGLNNYTCKCDPGWSGRICDQIALCASNPCGSHGTCKDNGKEFACFCSGGYSGKFCSESPSSSSSRWAGGLTSVLVILLVATVIVGLLKISRLRSYRKDVRRTRFYDNDF